MTVPPDRLYGRWQHAHEEDSGDQMVFRPASAALPPSRGRKGLDLRPDGSYAERRPGRDDRPQASSGTWRVDEDRLVVEEAETPQRAMRIVSAEPDKLVLLKQDP